MRTKKDGTVDLTRTTTSLSDASDIPCTMTQCLVFPPSTRLLLSQEAGWRVNMHSIFVAWPSFRFLRELHPVTHQPTNLVEGVESLFSPQHAYSNCGVGVGLAAANKFSPLVPAKELGNIPRQRITGLGLPTYCKQGTDLQSTDLLLLSCAGVATA